MPGPLALSPFSAAVNTELQRLLETSWKGDGHLVIPKTAGTFEVLETDSVTEVAFHDPAGNVPDVRATLPFPIRYLRAALGGMQSDFVRDSQALSQARTEFLSGSVQPWTTFFGNTSGDHFGMPIDATGPDPDIHQLMVGEGSGNAWKLSEFLSSLTPA